jgi:hypothetical protein
VEQEEEVDRQIQEMFEEEIVDQDHDHQEIVMDVMIEHIVIVINKELNDLQNVIQDLVHHHQKHLEIKL